MNNFWSRTISLFEIVGGAAGILFLLSGAVTTGLGYSFLAVAPILLAINGLSLLAGIYLWKRTLAGRNASIVVQFLQLPKIISSYLLFSVSFGFDIFPVFSFYQSHTQWGFQFRFLADNQFYLNHDFGQTGFGFSLVSIIFLFKLFAYSPELDTEMPTALDADPPSPDEYLIETDGPPSGP